MGLSEQPQPPHVLLVEDHPSPLEMLRQALAQEGYRVSVARTGSEALEAAQRIHPAVIITDVAIPDMDGYQLCRALKADAGTRSIPVMLLCPLREMDEIVMALESGADNFVRRPFEVPALLARIAFLLASCRLRSHSQLQLGIEVTLRGRRHLITAERGQILELLIASYQECTQAMEELRERQRELQDLNLQLAARVVDMERANEQLRSFHHAVSHELRSPLGTINGFSSILLQKYAASLDARGQHYLGAIRQESERMTRTVEDVQYLADIDRSRVSRTEVDLAALARAAVQELRQAQPEREVRFECADQAWVRCDARLARIALRTLLDNAWKFTRRTPQAQVAFRVEHAAEGEPVFCVEDNGAGFDMADAHRLFKPFERLHRADAFEGSGTGLVAAQRIVSLHGGRIWAQAAPGQGARFCFTLGTASKQA